MKSYITKPLSTRYSIIKQKRYSLGAFSYRKVDSKNQNIQTLENLIIDKKKWFEPWSDAYIPFSDNYFVRISEMEDLSFTFTITNQTNRIVPPEKSRQIIKKWDICYQTASNVGNVCLYDWPDAYYNSHIIRLNTEKKWYVFAFLKSAFCRNQVEVWWSIKWVDNFTEDFLLDTRIPFPTVNNHPHPEKIEEYISLLVQNMIDKEEQIKAKNEEIDRLIENELRENQKGNIFRYAYPRIWEIREETRFDTWIYEKEFKRISNLIDNYTDGKFYLDENKIAPGVTPKDYYFSDSKKNHNFYDWVTPKNIDQRQLAFHTYIFTKTKSKIKNNSLILNGIRYVGNGIFVEKGSCIYANQNTLIINQFDDKLKQLFLFCFLTSNLGKKLQLLRRNFWIVPILYTEHLCKISIPDFPESKQQELAKLYYNPIPENTDLTLETYLEREKSRNIEVGIFQLNMEIFELREKLEEIVDAIVMNREMQISF